MCSMIEVIECSYYNCNYLQPSAAVFSPETLKSFFVWICRKSLLINYYDTSYLISYYDTI